MPFRSSQQRRLFFAKNRRGEISDATLERWQDETKREQKKGDLPKKLPRYAKKTAAFDVGAEDGVKEAAKGEGRAAKFLKAFGPEAGIGLATALGAGAGNVLAGKPVEGGAIVGGLAGGASMLHSYLKNRKKLKR